MSKMIMIRTMGWWGCRLGLLVVIVLTFAAGARGETSDTAAMDASTSSAEPAGGDEDDRYSDARARRLLSEWRAATDPTDKKRLQQDATTEALRLQVVDVLQEVSGIHSLDEQLSASIRQVRVEPIHDYPLPDWSPESYHRSDPWIVRRIMKYQFELWTEQEGWLFAADGKVAAHAKLPSRNVGREWYGAFLPSGEWITTELEEYDHTIHEFNRAGKKVHSIDVRKMAPADNDAMRTPLVGWARSSADGTGWVMKLGSEEGFGEFFMRPGGKPELLKPLEAWKRCMPRQLGPRGWYIELYIPSDDFTKVLSRHCAGHGYGAEFPSFVVAEQKTTATIAGLDFGEANETSLFDITLHDGGRKMGFFPGSERIYVEASKDMERAPEVGYTERTYFFDEQGNYGGWITGSYIGDSADGKSLLIQAMDTVAVVDSAFELKETREYINARGQILRPAAVLDDLKMGFFYKPGSGLMLARLLSKAKL